MRVTGKKELLRVGGNSDVVQCMIRVYNECKTQCSELVEDLKSLPYEQQVRAVWDYFCDRVSYMLDDGNNQYLKIPARLLYDGQGDCKSYSLFFASCLYCLGIPFIFRFVAFQNIRTYQHVYVVAMPNTRLQIILDAVERDKAGNPVYNYASQFTHHKDIAG